MGQYKLDIRGFLHHFKRLLVLEDLADMGEQVKVCVTDTGNAENEVCFLVTEVYAVGVLSMTTPDFLTVDFFSLVPCGMATPMPM